MTQPSIRAFQNTTVSGGSGTLLTGNAIPAGAVVGDLLVCSIVRRKNTSFSAQTYTFPAGWTQLSGAYFFDGSRKSFDVWYRTCQFGDPGSTFNILSSDGSTGQNLDVTVISVQNWASTSGTYILSAGTHNHFTGSPTSWNGPTFSPSWGAVGQLNVEYTFTESAVNSVWSSAGNGYTNLTTYSANGTSSGMRFAVDYKGSASSPTQQDTGTSNNVGDTTQISILGITPKGKSQAIFM